MNYTNMSNITVQNIIIITGLPLVREKSGKFKVREKSGNFEKSQGNLEFGKKSGKFMIGQGIFNIPDENSG